MFDRCSKLGEIIFNNNTVTNNLKEMSYMFRECNKLQYINTKIFKVDKLTNLNDVFENCNSLKEIDLSHFKTENIKELSATFSGC